MICVVQRVLEATVTVEGEVVGQIGRGLLVLAAVQRGDTEADIQWVAAKLVSLRIFPSVDASKEYDRDVKEIGGGMLLVSNFTVAAQTRNGRRPGFDNAADPATGRILFDKFISAAQSTGVPIETGQFGADMKVSLVNDGPVTVLVESPSREKLSAD